MTLTWSSPLCVNAACIAMSVHLVHLVWLTIMWLWWPQIPASIAPCKQTMFTATTDHPRCVVVHQQRSKNWSSCMLIWEGPLAMRQQPAQDSKIMLAWVGRFKKARCTCVAQPYTPYVNTTGDQLKHCMVTDRWQLGALTRRVNKIKNWENSMQVVKMLKHIIIIYHL